MDWLQFNLQGKGNPLSAPTGKWAIFFGACVGLLWWDRNNFVFNNTLNNFVFFHKELHKGSFSDISNGKSEVHFDKETNRSVDHIVNMSCHAPIGFTLLSQFSPMLRLIHNEDVLFVSPSCGIVSPSTL